MKEREIILDMVDLIDFNSEDILSECNNMIAVFCGGVFEIHPMLGEIYRFDKPSTHPLFMKCPPFGSVTRNGMQYHCNYNWLMSAVKECKLKATTEKLKLLYENIKNALDDFAFNYEYQLTYSAIIHFIKWHNENKAP